MPDMSSHMGFVIADISRLLRKEFHDGMALFGLTQAQSRVLVYLSHYKGMKQVELADVLDIRPMTLARLIDQLEVEGLVERRTAPNDRRAYQLFLTDKAGPYLENMAEVADKVTKAAMRGFSKTEEAQLQAGLKKLRESLFSK